MRERFETQLLELSSNLLKMSTLCEDAISMAIEDFLKGNCENTKQVANFERAIDEKEQEIERLCLKLLLQQQPVAKDLRMVSAALKMITDLERIGDQALDIADLTRHCKKPIKNEHITKMAKETIKMVVGAIDSFVKRDVALAQQIIKEDDVVDHLFIEAKQDIIVKIKNDAEDAEVITDMLMVIKYLERIADHATNVAEWAVFSVTGDHPNGQ